MLPSVRTFDCPKIFGQNYRLSGPETKNLSFPLSVFLLSGFSMCCIKFHLCKKLKTGQVRFIRVMKKKYFQIIIRLEKLKIWLVQSNNVHRSCCTQLCADKTSTLWYCLGKTEWLGQS